MAEPTSDQELVERVQRGDRRAFDVLVLRYQQRIIKLIMRYVQDSSEAQDVAQEAFIKAYRALPNFRGESAFYTWLYRIAINTAKNYLVSQGRRAPTTTENEIEDAETFDDGEQLRDLNTPDSMLLTKQVAEAVNRAIDQLPEDLRTAIVLRELGGLSYEEIATSLGVAVGTVKSRLARARGMLRDALSST